MSKGPVCLMDVDEESESRKLPSAITLMCNFRSGIRYILSYTVKKDPKKHMEKVEEEMRAEPKEEMGHGHHR